jgi:CRP-like cAMP-binding protein
VDPAPVVYVKDFADSAVVYEIKVWIDDHALTSRVLSDVRSHAWYAVNRAGMEIPYPQLTLHRAPKADGATATRAAALAGLQAHPLFSFIGGEELQALVQESRVLLFAGSERIIKQGSEGASLFLLVRGQVDVHIDHGGKSSIVATLGPGNCFGEMSLLAGDPRTATVITRGEVEVIEIGKPAFASVVRANPAIVERLGELLAERQLANARHAAALAGATSPAEVRKGIVTKLRAFFELG